MFKLLLSAFLATLLVSSATVQGARIDDDEVFHRPTVEKVRNMIKHVKAHAKPVEVHANKNLRSTAMKTAEAATTDGTNYVLITEYEGKDCSSPVAHHSIYVRANALANVEDDGTISGYTAFTCRDGEVVLDTCVDKTCTTVSDSLVYSSTPGQCDTSHLPTSLPFVAHCVKSKQLFRDFKGLGSAIYFNSAEAAAANNMREASLYLFFELKTINPLPLADRIGEECSELLTAPGACVDLRKIKSYAYYPRGFTTATINLYTQFEGLGNATAFNYEEGVYDSGYEAYTFRYFTKKTFFFETYFNYEEFSN